MSGMRDTQSAAKLRLPVAAVFVFTLDEIAPALLQRSIARVTHLVVQEIAQLPIKVRRVSSGEHHFQIVAFAPVTLVAELFFDLLVELRARQRVGDTDADVIRA